MRVGQVHPENAGDTGPLCRKSSEKTTPPIFGRPDGIATIERERFEWGDPGRTGQSTGARCVQESAPRGGMCFQIAGTAWSPCLAN
jgi:hypothetical protein